MNNILNKALSNQTQNPEIISYQKMRRSIGWLAITLPFVTSLGYMIAIEKFTILDSISEYYYTAMRNIFVGTLSMIGLFLYAYKGYNKLENHVFNFAAVLCLLVAFFSMNPAINCDTNFDVNPNWPCTINISQSTACFDSNNFAIVSKNKLMLFHRDFYAVVHQVSATLLFILLGFVSFCFFTKTDRHRDLNSKHEIKVEKRARNAFYRSCGLIIWASLLFYAAFYVWIRFFAGAHYENYNCWPVLFFVELVCLETFGLAWLIKGGGVKLLNDK